MTHTTRQPVPASLDDAVRLHLAAAKARRQRLIAAVAKLPLARTS